MQYYVEQGGALDLLADQLAPLGDRGRNGYCEIGCGFGLSLDYARRGLGWRVAGVDPAPHAELGRQWLGLPIERRYATVDHPPAGAPFDVVACFELIEHLPDPQVLLSAVRAALGPGGLAYFSTPDARAIGPDAPDSLNTMVLGLGYHLLVYTAEGLEAALRRGGFAHVEVIVRDNSLLAAASDAPFALDWSALADPAVFGRYLEAAIVEDAGHPLAFGPLGRLVKHASNRGDWRALEAALDRYDALCRRRFGAGLDEMLQRDPPRVTENSDTALAALAAAAPFNLFNVFYRLAGHREWRADWAAAAAAYGAAARYAGALIDALAIDGFADGEAEHLLAEAETRGQACAEHAASARRRAFIDAVVLGQNAERADYDALAGAADRGEADADALWALAVYAARNLSDRARQIAWLKRLWVQPAASADLRARAGAETAIDLAARDPAAALSRWREAEGLFADPDARQAAARRVERLLFREFTLRGDYARASDLFPETSPEAPASDLDALARAIFLRNVAGDARGAGAAYAEAAQIRWGREQHAEAAALWIEAVSVAASADPVFAAELWEAAIASAGAEAAVLEDAGGAAVAERLFTHLAVVGRTDLARRHLVHGAALAEQQPGDATGAWAVAVTMMHESGDPQAAGPWFERAAAAAQAAGDRRLWALAAERAAVLASGTDPVQAEALFRRALEAIGPDGGLSPDVAAALAPRWFAKLVDRGDHGAARALAQAAEEVAGEAPDPLAHLWALGVHALNDRGDLEAAARWFDTLAEAAEAVGRRDFYWAARCHSVSTRARLGWPGVAEELAEINRLDHPERAVIAANAGMALAIAGDILYPIN